MNKNYQKAFTLVELAIVIVIIGLLVGGVLQGQELIKQAEVRSVIKQVQDYEVAIRIFKEKYSKYPGDINNATNFLGSTAVSPGNGDNNIGLVSETLALWQHLSLAKLIKGSFTGTATSTAWAEIGTNVPEFSVRNASAWVFYDTTAFYGTPRGNLFWIAGRATSASPLSDLSNGFVSPEIAYQIDQKTDDGLPGAGKLIAGKGTSETLACVTPDATVYTSSPASYPTSYNLTITSKTCMFVYASGL